MLENELKKVGLSDKEARVYLAALELGSAPVQDIAEKAGVNRTTTYVAIENLIEKGLISEVEDNRKKLFIAENPDNINRIYRQKEEELKKEQENIYSILPQLKALFNFGSLKPKMRYYEDSSGIENILEELLKSQGKIIKLFINIDDAQKQLSIYKDEYIKKFADEGYKLKLFYTGKNILNNFLNTSGFVQEALYFPIEICPLDAGFIILKNVVYVIFLNREPIIGIVIEDKSFASTLDALFELSWKKCCIK